MKNTQDTSLAKMIESQLDKFFLMYEKNTDMSYNIYDIVIAEAERALITKALHHANGVQMKAAKILGINRNTLRKKIQLLEIAE